MKKIILSLLLLAPSMAFAVSLPAFPMTLYGTVTVNDATAPVGTVIRAYYGTTVAGEVTTTEIGVYGYNNPTKQQLLVGEGTSTISFTFQSAVLNGGVESAGTATVIHATFESGESREKNMAFSFALPTPPTPPATPPAPPTTASSGNTSGGGGGGGTSLIYGCMDKKATNYSSIANTDNKACIFPIGITSTTATTTPTPAMLPLMPKLSGEVLGATAFVFTKNLGLGSTGIDVTELQKRLTALGHYSGPTSGYYGTLTAQAVKKYQASKGLETTGGLGPKTRAALNQTGSVLGASVSTSVTVLTPEAKATLIQKILAMILELQKQLAELKAKGG